MKKHITKVAIFCSLFLLFQQKTIGQLTPSTTKNYIITYSPKTAVSATSELNNLPLADRCPVIHYVDGLGRPTQNVAVANTPSGDNLVSQTDYDVVGRPNKNWLPFKVLNSTLFVGDVSTSSGSFYNGTNQIPSDNKPYGLNIYDLSPLNRVTKAYGPGDNWQDNIKGITSHWNTNNNSLDSLKVNKYTVLSNNNVSKSYEYANGSLFVTSQTDEDGHKTWTFTDKLGQVILTRTDGNVGSGSSRYLDTYYVYDELGRKRYVLPPLASANMTANTSWSLADATTPLYLYGYYYRYDNRGNCIEKKLPGVVSEHMVYDKADRLVLYQDGNQRSASKWTFNKYDALGRPTMRGSIKLVGVSHESLLNTYVSSSVVESFNTSNTSNYGYSNTFFSGRESLYEILYYDDYSFINSSWMPGSRATNLAWNSTEALDARYSSSSKGLLTGRIGFLPANINSKEYIAYYYDKKGRLVQQNGTNHFNPASNYGYGYDHFNYAYDFKGNVLHKSHRQKGTFAGTILLEGTYHTYDPAGRLLQTSHYVNSGSPVVTSSNSYNELGQLQSKTIGNNLETQNYAYNIRGWLKSMTGKYFREALYYETTRSSGAGYYNGNISQSDIRYHAGDHNASLAAGIITPTSGGTPLQFNYTYDHLNRLTYAQTMGSSGQFNELLTYDKHGNIASLDRVGILEHYWTNPYTPDHTISAIDDLDYTYDGNRVISISDNASMYDPMYTGSQDFKGGTTQTGEYAYDANGNMSSDLNKNISTIKYNFLNLPDTTQMVNGHLRTCNYDASGDKVFVHHRTVTGSGVTMQPGWTLFNHSTGYTIAGTVITMYLDNVIYKDYNVDKLIDSDGILIRTNPYTETTPVFKRNYYIKDHLGNVRVVFDDTGIIKQVNNYYPFGMEYGESAQTATLAELTYQNHLFGGKELDREFQINTYDFDARGFDQTSGRFTTMDPLAEDYYESSPYAYGLNNPLRYNDPTGMASNDTINGGSKPEVVLTESSLSMVGNMVMSPVSGLWENISSLLFGRTYNGGGYFNTSWSVNRAGIITGVAPLTGMPPLPATKGISIIKGSKIIAAKTGLKGLKSLSTTGNNLNKVLQTGGHTLNNSTLKALGLTKQQGKIAIESLKKDLRLPPDFHSKIMGNGDLVHPHTGNVLGNIFDYLY